MQLCIFPVIYNLVSRKWPIPAWTPEPLPTLVITPETMPMKGKEAAPEVDPELKPTLVSTKFHRNSRINAIQTSFVCVPPVPMSAPRSLSVAVPCHTPVPPPSYTPIAAPCRTPGPAPCRLLVLALHSLPVPTPFVTPPSFLCF